MTKEITIGPIDISGPITVSFADLELIKRIRIGQNAGYDPCDEMITDRQVVDMVFYRWRFNDSPQEGYECAAAIWGIDYEAAKLRIYKYCYGG